MVEVMEETNGVVWVPAIVVKEMENGNNFMVKSCKYLSWNDEVKPTRCVSSRNIRPIPPPLSVENYGLMEPVEVFIDPGWRPGIVMNILCGNQYTVCLEATKESLVFKHSDLRPLKESIIQPFMRNSTEVDATITRQRSLYPVENAIPEGELVVVPTREPSVAQGSGNEMADDVRHEAGTSDITGGTLTKLTEDKAQGNDSTRDNEISEDENRKRKREENRISTANVEETRAYETTMVLPFEKKLLIWKKIESLDVFKTFPQSPHFSPHFSPLVETEEDFREMSAVGMVYTYSALLEEVRALKCFSPVSTLKGLRDSFAMLEKHGFDVKAPQLRIQKLLSLKDRQAEITEELKGAEIKIAGKENEKVEFKRKIVELEDGIAQLKSCAETIEQELEDVELQIWTTASAPW
ncbi:LOW QUALITY PROTEIN: DUF724 domain-containing protein 8 [Eutrema salsugineum]|uniref:LOW QUALITY PROTEIN: DUF724 domain-containing protein 8 n=1 Tax=Eutrema salsugineum TaxID=72664 RepID=UPI000CED7D58|nr:LOW QUALITY PROTEIN: DUF724 domain-containing protein 8 [Eutrema salsugineum]